MSRVLIQKYLFKLSSAKLFALQDASPGAVRLFVTYDYCYVRIS